MAGNISVNGEQQAMLVNTVKLMDVPEELSTPTSVWLKKVDLIYRFLPHTFYSSVPHGFVILGSLGSGEANLVEMTRKPRTHRKHVASQVVESASQVVNGITYDHGNIERNFCNT